MVQFINSFKKTPALVAGLFISLLLISCGSSYQAVTYGNDGIYDSATPVNTNRVQNNTNPNNTVASSDSYFSRKALEYEQAAASDDVLTDVESYSSDIYDEPEQEYNDNSYAAWGENTQQTNYVYANANVGWGWNNYQPFWNRGFRNGYGYYGGGFYNNYYGFYDPYYYGGFYGSGLWGNNFWYGNGYWNRGFYNRGYNRNYRGTALNSRRSTSRTYSSNRVNAQRSSARSSRSYSPRQSSSTLRGSNSSNRSSRSYSTRGSNSSRSYSPRSSSSSSRGNSSSARSSRSSSSSSGSYRRR